MRNESIKKTDDEKNYYRKSKIRDRNKKKQRRLLNQ